MRINKVARNKVEIVDGDRRVAVEINRLSKNYIITITDGEKVADLTVKNIESAKVIQTLRKFGISDVRRAVSYLSAMAMVKRIEAPRSIFMRTEDVIYVPEGGGEPKKKGEIVETYFHSYDGTWRVFVKNYDADTKTEQYELKEAFNIIAPIKDTSRLFLHYNTVADVDPGIVNELCNVAKEVREVLEQYIILDENYYNVATAWIIATYMRWAAPYAELLIIRKLGFGSGGSTLLKTVRLLSARPLRLVVNTSPAAFYRIVDFAMPTIAIDEIREDELDKDKLSELKLLAESAFDSEYVVLRVEEGEIVGFNTYANVAVVDTTDRFTTYSAERRAWTVVIKPSPPPRHYDAEEILKATESLREKLYMLGIAMPVVFLPQWKTAVKEQGLGILDFLKDAANLLCGGCRIFESAYKTVEKQLKYAKQTALLTDPKRLVAETLQRVINDARRELQNAASEPDRAAEYIKLVIPEDAEYKCGIIRLDKLVRELRRRFMEVVQADTTKLYDGVDDSETSSSSTSKIVRFWFRVNQDVEMYLKPAKLKAILMELDITLEYDNGRHYYVRVCRQ